MFTRMGHPTPTTLNQAYAKAIEIGKQLGQQGMEPLSIRYANNPIPQLAYQAPANQLVVQPGPPLSQLPPSMPVYLQGASSSTKTQEEKDEMKELIEQVKKLSIEVTYLRNQNNQLQAFQRNNQGSYQGNNYQGGNYQGGYQRNNQEGGYQRNYQDRDYQRNNQGGGYQRNNQNNNHQGGGQSHNQGYNNQSNQKRTWNTGPNNGNVVSPLDNQASTDS